MARNEVLQEIKEAMGFVPGFIECLPDDVLEENWTLMKRFQLEETKIPLKYKQLIGLSVAAYNHCRYCILFHTEMAKLFGATDEEIMEANLLAKETAGWSTLLNGSQYDFDLFKREVRQAVDNARKAMRAKAA
ncbi:MAG: carboxymuconolactone decarboxylase family protein [Chloroflexi bacterium]|nr:carboxymuconolactone decarboxylase family protein [Chloroflexota bacterium]